MKLDNSHINKIQHLFHNINEYEIKETASLNALTNYEQFTLNYLGNLKLWHSFTNSNFQGLIGFYQSIDESAWYLTQIKYTNFNVVPDIINEVINYNENQGRKKFYCVFNENIKDTHHNILNAQQVSRYNYIDEFYVDPKQKCLYNLPWQILYNRQTYQTRTFVRCYYLVQSIICNAGNI